MEDSREPIVQFESVTKRFGNLTAVDNLSFEVPCGSLFGFLGANGAGKSTTLKMLMGLVRPSSGGIRLFGEPCLGRPKLRRHVGALIEGPAAYDHLSGRANLQIFGRLAGGVTNGQVDELLEQVGLGKAARRKAGGYSQGMRQRLGLAMAMLGEPKLLVLDEPTNGLDPEGSREIWSLLRRLVSERGVTVLISSHLLNEVEEGCDRLAIIDRGRLVCCQSVEELLREGSSRVAVEFVDASTAQRARRAAAHWDDVELDHDALTDAASTRVLFNIGDTSPATFNRRLGIAGLSYNFIQPADRTLKDFFLAMRDKSRSEEESPAAGPAPPAAGSANGGVAAGPPDRD